MRLIDWFFMGESEEGISTIGIQWCWCQQYPFMYIAKPDRSYWSYLNVRLLFFKRALWIDIRMRQLPYRNKKEFLSCNREFQRTRVHLDQ